MDREIRKVTKEYWTAIVKLAEQGNKDAIKICKGFTGKTVMRKLGVKRPRL